MVAKIMDQFWFDLPEKEKKQLYQFSRLLNIMSRLREVNGCPWDREQTHQSLKPFLLEETYEVLEQLEQENLNGLQEELGDLLLQIVFHAQIADEADQFSIEDIAKGISDKMIRRHPHIFGDVRVENADQVLDNWQKIKTEEKLEAGIITAESSLLDQVNSIQPALMEAQKLQLKAAKVGFDWDNIEGALAKVEEELGEVISAIKNNDEQSVQEEIGDLFFAVVNVARFALVESELVLRQTNQKFRRRFRGVEKRVKDRSENMEDLSLDVLDGYWEEAKQEEKNN